MVSDLIITNNNQKTSVIINKKSLEDIIKTLLSVIDGIRINVSKTEVQILPNYNNINIFIEIKIAKNLKISSKIREIKNNIENHFLFLINSKPENIIITYIGNF